MLSVVLCTYNGAKYLKDQLKGIAAQTRLPGELIIADDCSTDKTLQIAYDFAKDSAFPVRIETGTERLGFISNFERGIRLAYGDTIVLCDQDDVWLPNKLELQMKAFTENPSLGFLFTNGDVVDEDLESMMQTLFDYAGFTHQKQKRIHQGDAFDVFMDKTTVTGATLMFKASLRDLVLPIPTDTGLYHDAWIAIFAAAAMDVDFIPDLLIKYRQHRNQVTGVRKNERPVILGRNHYLKQVALMEQIDQRLARFERDHRYPHILSTRAKLAERIAHVRLRIDLPSNIFKRIAVISSELIHGRYVKYSNGLRSVMRDLM